MSEIPIEINFTSGLITIALLLSLATLAENALIADELSKRPLGTSGLLGSGSMSPKHYQIFPFLAKNIFGLFDFKDELLVLFNNRTDRGYYLSGRNS